VDIAVEKKMGHGGALFGAAIVTTLLVGGLGQGVISAASGQDCLSHGWWVPPIIALLGSLAGTVTYVQMREGK
jgi:hypothetical protein